MHPSTCYNVKTHFTLFPRLLECTAALGLDLTGVLQLTFEPLGFVPDEEGNRFPAALLVYDMGKRGKAGKNAPQISQSHGKRKQADPCRWPGGASGTRIKSRNVSSLLGQKRAGKPPVTSRRVLRCVVAWIASATCSHGLTHDVTTPSVAFLI